MLLRILPALIFLVSCSSKPLFVPLPSEGEWRNDLLRYAQENVQYAESLDVHPVSAEFRNHFPDLELVSTAEGAVQIHRVVAGSVFDRVPDYRGVESQRPFHPVRSGKYWVVSGSLPSGWLGSTAITVIRASDGKIMAVFHG